ncbi:MAG: RNA-guided endonuclease TnpB family protein [Acidobacteriota bacterium]|nr:RNA-guided endonuclease TnpB family protein [Acidobacteriota bacterium]
MKCKLIVTPHVANELKAMMREFAQACNLIAEVASEKKLHRKYDLHHATYSQVREQTILPSQHVINALAKVSEQLARERNKQHKFKPLSSVRYDSRTLTFKRDFHEATLTVCPKGRVCGEIQTTALMREKLRTWKVGSADLICRDGEFYLHIAVSANAPEVSEPSGSLGVDLGVKRLAVTSDGEFHAARLVRHKKRCFQATRSGLQANGSARAKRTLKRVSGRERRYVTDVNHCLSKKIVHQAQTSGRRVVLEDLTGIRGRAAKYMHKYLHGWSFAQLRSFIEYKAATAGVECVTVDPHFTSIGCSRCLHLGSRSSQSHFTCGHCGMRGNADLNAARGIAQRHDLLAMGGYFCTLEVSQPAPKSQASSLEASRCA